MQRWARLAGVLAIAVTLAAPAAAAAVPEDSVTGFAAAGLGRRAVDLTLDAHSGPSGENPTGIVGFNTFLGGDLGDLPVHCLSVSGNRATIVVRISPSPPAPAGVLISVEDNGPTGDRADWGFIDALPAACPAPAAVLEPIRAGDIIVQDAAPLPTSKAQCKRGGWQTFGVFKNQGDCIHFVRQQARQACLSERAASGVPAFRAKYGRGRLHVHAMRRCIRRNGG
jgi:hypothetical protein